MGKQGTILIVDDTEMNRSMLSDMLQDNYNIMEAANGMEAARLLQQRHEEISLVLLDIVMPEMDGFEVLALMNKNGWIGHLPVITISSETAATYIDHAYDLGASDYISRPFDEKTVQRRVRNMIMLYSKQKALENIVTEQIIEKERNNFLMIEILSNIVEFRNGESGLHVLHIRTLTEVFLHHLQKITDRYPLSASRMALIVNASALHDVGKISIPEEILNKPGKLSDEEFEMMKTHSALGAQIMADALQRHDEELLQIAYHICRWHHERWDGRGYPDGLTRDQIPIEAQVVALADVYDALTSVRVYKPAYSHETAMAMILSGQCGVFNPLLLDCLREVGPTLQNELRLRSQNPVSEVSLRELSTQVIAGNTLSSRTLTLLEQERIKYQFFASMSNEIQFEYRYQSDLLTISDWGARQLGLPMLIEHPETSEELRHVFAPLDYQDFKSRLHQATSAKPILSNMYNLNIKGSRRWFKMVARPLWEGEEEGQILGVIGKFIDDHEEQLRLEQLRRMAEQDSLTRLSNHASARNVIRQALTNTDKKYALILFDLDNFKEANDHFGHLFGDEILKHVAQRVRQSIRDRDVAARIGGDEFLLFLEYSGNIEQLISRIFSALRGEEGDFQLRVSMGVALAPEHGRDYEFLFHQADQALYAAKRNGKDRFCFYNESMSELLSVLSEMDN